jgi:hypothetical protein
MALGEREDVLAAQQLTTVEGKNRLLTELLCTTQESTAKIAGLLRTTQEKHDAEIEQKNTEINALAVANEQKALALVQQKNFIDFLNGVILALSDTFDGFGLWSEKRKDAKREDATHHVDENGSVAESSPITSTEMDAEQLAMTGTVNRLLAELNVKSAKIAQYEIMFKASRRASCALQNRIKAYEDKLKEYWRGLDEMQELLRTG